jgi:hypothetical protein
MNCEKKMREGELGEMGRGKNKMSKNPNAADSANGNAEVGPKFRRTKN